MKLFMLALITLAMSDAKATSLHPDTFTDIPKVICEITTSLMADKQEDVMSKSAVLPVTEELSSVKNGTFTLEAKLEKNCAWDGTNGTVCAGYYELNVTLKSGNSIARLPAIINPNVPGQKYSLGLTVGNKNSFVNCDLK